VHIKEIQEAYQNVPQEIYQSVDIDKEKQKEDVV